MDIQAFWRDVLAQDRAALPGWFHPEALIRWHCSNEEFTVSEYVRANCDYPGDWDGTVQRVERQGELLVSVVRVFPRDRSASWHVVSFLRLREGRIAALDEYWADDGEAPAWRKSLGLGRAIRA